MLLEGQHGSLVLIQFSHSVISTSYARLRAGPWALNDHMCFGKIQVLACTDDGTACQLRLQHHWPSAATHRGSILGRAWFSLNLWREP